MFIYVGSRCRLQSGKTIWLCDKHTTQMRLTVLSDEVTDTQRQSTVQVGVDQMIESLRSHLDAPFKFSDSFKVKRKPSGTTTSHLLRSLLMYMYCI